MGRTDTASRIIDAPAQVLYDAHLDPVAVACWRPPRGMRAEIHAFDAHVSGGYRMSFIYVDSAGKGRGKTRPGADVFVGEFLILEPATRIVERVRFESDDPSFAEAMTVTTSFRPVDGGTEVQIVCENVPAAISSADHALGMTSTLANLAAYTESRWPSNTGVETW